MFWALLWLFSPVWDTVRLTLIGFICHFMLTDATYLGATIVVAQALGLTIPNAEFLSFYPW